LCRQTYKQIVAECFVFTCIINYAVLQFYTAFQGPESSLQWRTNYRK